MNPNESNEIVIKTNTVGISFKQFYEYMQTIREMFIDAFTDEESIKLSNIAIRLHNDAIPLISLQIGTDGNLYITITESKNFQCEPNGPTTFVLNSYEKLVEFDMCMDAIYKHTFNTAVNIINDAECIVISEGIVTHVTSFDLLVKHIGKDNKSITIYIRSEV